MLPELPILKDKETVELVEFARQASVRRAFFEPLCALRTGSRMYGLETENSDNDVIILTNAPAKTKPYKHVFPECDITIESGLSFANNILATSNPVNVDLLRAGVVYTDNMLTPLFRAIRFNEYLYHMRVHRVMVNNIEQAIRFAQENNAERCYKRLKLVARLAIVDRRVEYDRQHYRPVFTQNERERYFELVNLLTTCVLDHDRTTEHVVAFVNEHVASYM